MNDDPNRTPDPDDDDPDVSGWGFELTFRLRMTPGESTPEWPFVMINEIAKQVNSGGIRKLDAGGRIDLRAPITGHPNVPGAPATGLTVYALTRDPELGEILTPNGRVEFLQLVGVTAIEKGHMLTSSTAGVLAGLADGNPLLITDPHRA